MNGHGYVGDVGSHKLAGAEVHVKVSCFSELFGGMKLDVDMLGSASILLGLDHHYRSPILFV